MGWDFRFRAPQKVFDFHLNSFLFISTSSQLKILSIYIHTTFWRILLSTTYLTIVFYILPFFSLPYLQPCRYFIFIKLNRFCVFVAFLLYTIWFLSTSFIVRLKFYIWVYRLCWKYKLLSLLISYSSHLIVFVVVVLVDIAHF